MAYSVVYSVFSPCTIFHNPSQTSANEEPTRVCGVFVTPPPPLFGFGGSSLFAVATWQLFVLVYIHTTRKNIVWNSCGVLSHVRQRFWALNLPFKEHLGTHGALSLKRSSDCFLVVPTRQCSSTFILLSHTRYLGMLREDSAAAGCTCTDLWFSTCDQPSVLHNNASAVGNLRAMRAFALI